jgi:hypothetical protein
MRRADSFQYGEFKRAMAKFVRANHVQATKHNWQMQAIVPNGFMQKF